MKKFTFILLLFISFLGFSQTTAIPDKNFEQALIDLGIDTDGTINASVLTSDISGVTTLEVTNKNIADLSGIEGFTSLKRLMCYKNQLTNLDVSKNNALVALMCFSNQLTSLDVSKNNALESLWCQDNQLKSLDLRNGNNKNLSSPFLKNPNLKCILVDNAAYSAENWKKIDKISKFVNKKLECK